MPLTNKTWLITGGTGSFGTRMTEVLLAQYQPRKIIIFSEGELAQVQMKTRLNDNRLRFIIGSVENIDDLDGAMGEADIVIHAAAKKNIDSTEYNPHKTVAANIIGSMNVVKAATAHHVDLVFGISSDKAVQPANLYGATKNVMEKVFIQGNIFSKGKTRFACSRYGNVVASNGSVVPIFREQAKTGILTLTDDRMTRFWLTLDQGVQFVLNCLQMTHGGEIFVPKIPSMRVRDLALAIAPDAAIKTTGIRPGEKLHEILLTKEESRHAHEFEDHFLIVPEFQFWSEDRPYMLCGKMSEYEYTSDMNPQWLNKEDLRRIVNAT
jgi:UDP-N-acetylglucosamine 4,6-dehydratase